MKKAFSEFQGRHDFRAFAKRVHRYGEKTEREIFQAEIKVKAHSASPDLNVIWFVVRGKGFMHHMVRTMVGTTLEIGKGESHDVRTLLRRGKRQDAGVNAPPHGLVLWRTEVSRSLFRSWDVRS
jgi:tRNA pseudouridine38-40 synthase